MLAATSSGVGERQEGVKRAWKNIVAKFGKLRQSGKRAREQQRLGRDAERIDTRRFASCTRVVTA